jgi:hypothetical protein
MIPSKILCQSTPLSKRSWFVGRATVNFQTLQRPKNASFRGVSFVHLTFKTQHQQRVFRAPNHSPPRGDRSSILLNSPGQFGLAKRVSTGAISRSSSLGLSIRIHISSSGLLRHRPWKHKRCEGRASTLTFNFEHSGTNKGYFESIIQSIVVSSLPSGLAQLGNMVQRQTAWDIPAGTFSNPHAYEVSGKLGTMQNQTREPQRVF